jgi:hypothetical protein
MRWTSTTSVLRLHRFASIEELLREQAFGVRGLRLVLCLLSGDELIARQRVLCGDLCSWVRHSWWG